MDTVLQSLVLLLGKAETKWRVFMGMSWGYNDCVWVVKSTSQDDPNIWFLGRVWTNRAHFTSIAKTIVKHTKRSTRRRFTTPMLVYQSVNQIWIVIQKETRHWFRLMPFYRKTFRCIHHVLQGCHSGTTIISWCFHTIYKHHISLYLYRYIYIYIYVYV